MCRFVFPQYRPDEHPAISEDRMRATATAIMNSMETTPADMELLARVSQLCPPKTRQETLDYIKTVCIDARKAFAEACANHGYQEMYHSVSC